MVQAFFTEGKSHYNIFGSHHSMSNTQKTVLTALNKESLWRMEKDDEKFLAKLKKHIKECNREDFDSEVDYHVELGRRINLYSTAKEVVYIKRKRMADYLS